MSCSPWAWGQVMAPSPTWVEPVQVQVRSKRSGMRSMAVSYTHLARTAMAAMAQAGVIQGNEQGKLNPTGTLNRAEMAVILHRALTL